MKLGYSDADREFRGEIRAFLRDNLPPALAAQEARSGHVRPDDYADWHRRLASRGWAAPGWPVEHGGTGWSPVQRHIWEVEYARANGPEISVIGIGLVGPVICRFGSDALKARYLGRILEGDIIFCQGFSEPQAGSDLASVRTRALRDGTDFLVTGQKVWTSHAADADYMICLCRTDPAAKPQAGLSMLILPMDAPGVTVRAIPSIDGCETVSEVFLEEVRVPAHDLIGEENKAWTYAKFLLTTERTHNAYIGILHRYLDRLQALPDLSDAFRRRLSLLAIDIDALDWSVLRVLAGEAGTLAGASASALKLAASELLIRAGEMEIEGLGLAALPDRALALPEWVGSAAEGKVNQLLYWRASTIFGGANEIQRGIIWSALARQAS